MLRNSFKLVTIGGIEVGIHASWLIIFALLTFSLATGYFPNVAPDLDAVTVWVLGAVGTLALFGSVLLHELAHSFMAKARGIEARSITLFIFGGVSSLGSEAKQPGVEFIVAVVGPLTSFAIGGVMWLLANAAGSGALEALFSYLAVVNLLVGGFNLIPAYPLDGGRVLRAIAWKISGSLRTGTDIAAGAGQVIGGLMILLGIIQAVSGNLLNGLWILAIGWFLQSAASASQHQMVLEQRLNRVRVGDVVRTDPTTVPPTVSVAELIERYLLPRNRRAMPVAEDGRLVGIVTISDINEVPPEDRDRVRVGDIMGGRDGLVSVTPRQSLADAFRALGERDLEQVPVVDDGRIVGMLTRADVMRQFQLREELDVQAART